MVGVLRIPPGLPVVIGLADTEEMILAVVPEIEAMVEHGLVTVQKVRMSRYGKPAAPGT